nr:hypothetical protein [Helicobacter marmotae]
MEKEKRESASDSLRDSSLDSQAQNDKLTTFTRNPNSNSSALTQYGRNNTSQLESKIDNLVYQLYGLSEEEIKIIKIG